MPLTRGLWRCRIGRHLWTPFNLLDEEVPRPVVRLFARSRCGRLVDTH